MNSYKSQGENFFCLRNEGSHSIPIDPSCNSGVSFLFIFWSHQVHFFIFFLEFGGLTCLTYINLLSPNFFQLCCFLNWPYHIRKYPLDSTITLLNSGFLNFSIDRLKLADVKLISTFMSRIPRHRQK